MLAVSVILAVGFASYVFRRYLRYVPRVVDHVPADYAVALRLDVEHRAVREPFRRHFLPLLDADPGLWATLDLDDELCEVGIVVDGAGQWLVLLGGRFPSSGIVRDVAGRFEERGVQVRLERTPERLIHGSGAALGEGQDGVLALASGERLLLTALEPRDPGVGFRAGTALSLAVGPSGDSALAGLELDVWPGQEFPIELRLPRAGEQGRAQAVAPLLSGNTGDFKLFARPLPWQIAPSPGGALRGSAVLSSAEFDAAVAELATSLRTLLGLAASSPLG